MGTLDGVPAAKFLRSTDETTICYDGLGNESSGRQELSYVGFAASLYAPLKAESSGEL